ncbi:MAG TPA: peptidoglycan-binding domain-containing protein [Candidatus Paceibacterota bacterium]
MKRFIYSLSIAGLFAALLVVMPAPAQAAGLTEAQIQAVIDLVSSFGADASIVKNVESSLKGNNSSKASESVFKGKTSTSTLDSTTANWLKLRSFLRMGSNGEDVRVLQKILSSDPSLYPEGLVTGFFGPLTELAVKRLQAKLKIDQVGAVGPQTLAKINELLAGFTSEDLANSRIKIEVKIKDGQEEIKFEIKCDSSGSGNTCNNLDDDEDDDEDEDTDDDTDEDEDDEDEDDD